MKRYAAMAALALFLGNSSNAAVIDLAPGHAGVATPVPSSPPLPDLAATSQAHIITPPTHLPELPEPEVFAMMLVGLVLIGYKATRNSSDKFT